jgi:hypothetical protein
MKLKIFSSDIFPLTTTLTMADQNVFGKVSSKVTTMSFTRIDLILKPRKRNQPKYSSVTILNFGTEMHPSVKKEGMFDNRKKIFLILLSVTEESKTANSLVPSHFPQNSA